jgi:hypothetical protein
MSKPKFRCSGLSHLMTEPKSAADKAAGNLSEGAKVHALNTWISHTYKRREEVYSKYLEKGNETEEDSITLVSLAYGVFLKKNETFVENDWICGTPDLFTGPELMKAETIRDTKSSYDIYTFLRTKQKGLPDSNYWQIQCYCWLTGAKVGYVDYCLNNATPDLILDELRKVRWAMRTTDSDESPEFVKRAQMIERLMIYDLPGFRKRYPNFDLYTEVEKWEYDVPQEQRIHTFEIEAKQSEQELIKRKVEKAWEYMESL